MTCVERYPVGKDVTAYASAAVTEGTFVKITGTRKSRALGSNYTAGPATADGAVFGVAKETAAQDATFGVHGPGKIVPVLVGTGGVTAGGEVEVGTGATAVAYNDGIKVGMALTTASAGAYADVRIY